jgi:hypothetical protein
MKAPTLALMVSLTLLSTPTFSMTAAAPTQAMRQPSSHLPQHSRGGRWYFAATGHAVYCYGPVMTVPQANGDLQKVATFCQDGRAVVPLKD